MLFYYYKTLAAYDLLNKFKIAKLCCLPKIKRIVLTFSFSNYDFKELLKTTLAVELAVSKKVSLTSINRHNKILLQIQNGFTKNYKITLRKKFMFIFLEKVIFNVISAKQAYNALVLEKGYLCSLKLDNFSYLPELSNKQLLFGKLQNLNIELLTNAKKLNELTFLIKTLKFPL